MKNRRALVAIVIAAITSLCRATPEDDAKAVLQGFLAEFSYKWVSSDTRGVSEEEMPNQAAMGEHEKGGFTKVWFLRGPHIPKEDQPAAKPLLGFMDREEIWSDRWIFETPDGYKSLRELPPPPLPPGVGPNRRPTSGGVSIPLGSARASIGFRTMGFWRPDHEIALVLENLASVEALGNAAFQAEVTPAGAAQLVLPWPPGAPMRPSIENATATLKFWSADGKLTRYEIAVAGEIVALGHRQSRDFVRKRRLADLGTTTVDVPDEVKKRFDG